MASKLTLNAKNLEALGAARLAELLLELSNGNGAAKRQLRLALAAGSSVEEAAQEVRKRLASIGRSGTYIDWRKRNTLASDLQAQHRAITGPIAAADAAIALELLWRFLDLADGVLARSSDGSGTLADPFRAALADLGPLASAAGAEPLAIADQLFELLGTNDYGQFDGLLPAVAAALGEPGLARLEALILQQGLVDGQRVMLQIAEARGDLDAYLARVPAQQLQWPDGAAAVADRFLAADRAEEALAILDQAAQAAKSWSSPHWTESRIAALDALRRSDEAQALRWQAFGRTLSIPYLRAYLQGLPAFEDVEAEEKAFALVEHHPNPIEALAFLVAWPALPRAATYVLHHWDQDSWDGQDQAPLAAAAERLSGPSPLAATKLYRQLLVEALWLGGAKRHRQAVSHLGTCKDLAAAIADWQGLEDHGAFVAGLRDSFAMNWSVRALLDD